MPVIDEHAEQRILRNCSNNVPGRPGARRAAPTCCCSVLAHGFVRRRRRTCSLRREVFGRVDRRRRSTWTRPTAVANRTDYAPRRATTNSGRHRRRGGGCVGAGVRLTGREPARSCWPPAVRHAVRRRLQGLEAPTYLAVPRPTGQLRREDARQGSPTREGPRAGGRRTPTARTSSGSATVVAASRRRRRSWLPLRSRRYGGLPWRLTGTFGVVVDGRIDVDGVNSSGGGLGPARRRRTVWWCATWPRLMRLIFDAVDALARSCRWPPGGAASGRAHLSPSCASCSTWSGWPGCCRGAGRGDPRRGTDDETAEVRAGCGAVRSSRTSA